ncbi:hypothetical protein GCM10028819_51470 [Spirosoma humi]
MFSPSLADQLETDFGTAILSQLARQSLTRNQQLVRLFDQTRNSAERYYISNKRGKPVIYNHQTNECWYPITAYAKAYNVDFMTALFDLYHLYYGIDLNGKRNIGITSPSNVYRPREQSIMMPLPKVGYLPIDLYERSQILFERNGLYEYLGYTFSFSVANKAFSRYRLGTSNYWQYLGYLSTCLPQFDIDGNLRQVKIIPFDAMNGRRVKIDQEAEHWDQTEQRFKSTKSGESKIFFAGKRIAKQAGITDIHLKQCLFGEHLLNKYPNKKVALVEGESTAIVCSLIWHEYVWLATGGSSGAGWTKPETFSVLKGKDVVLWPDTGKLTDWQKKAEFLRPLVQSLYVTDYVQQNALTGENNVDLRDILMRPRYRPADGSGMTFGEVL